MAGYRTKKRKGPLRGKAANRREETPESIESSRGNTELVTHKLQKVLAQAGLGSRRKMETVIEDGLIKVNGKVATLGTRVSEKDRIEYGPRRVQVPLVEHPRILMYHKPDGEIVTRNDPKGRPTVFEKLPKPRNSKWIAIGRLDFNTSGLLIFTTSGDLANRLMHPSFEVEREYSVRIFGELDDEQISLLCSGLRLTDGIGVFQSCAAIGGEGKNRWYKVVVKEGRNRFVRRMFEALGYQVSRLIRIRYGNVILPPRLTRGRWREFEELEAKSLFTDVGFNLPYAQLSKPRRSSSRVRKKTKSWPA